VGSIRNHHGGRLLVILPLSLWLKYHQLLKEPLKPATDLALANCPPGRTRHISTSGLRRKNGERAPLLRRWSLDESGVVSGEGAAPPAPPAGGTVLGIHNLAIVAPQFLVRLVISYRLDVWTSDIFQVAIVNSIIFKIVDGPVTISSGVGGGETYYGKTGVGWVLRFGGLCAFIGAFVARMVPPTPTERDMRRRLGEMQLLGEEPSPWLVRWTTRDFLELCSITNWVSIMKSFTHVYVFVTIANCLAKNIIRNHTFILSMAITCNA